MINCKQATAMASQQLDRELSLRQRLSLKLHLLICRYCRNYRRQLRFLHRIAPRLQTFIEEHSDIHLPPQRKESIRKSLKEQE
jgi:predicted anti-sigma-YlaC factor YlaD